METIDKLALAELESKSKEERVKDFSDILDSIESLDTKKKVLWKEIYENAITDRGNAYVMFAKLVRICEENSTEHAVHGRTVSAFIERMSRANDQLLKLVDIIRREEEKADSIDSDDMFDKIGSR